MKAETSFRSKHRSILLNLFELEELSVDDVMTPRARIEALDLDQPRDAVLEQLRTCYHNKLPVHEGDSQPHDRHVARERS